MIRTFGGYAPEDLLGRTRWELMHPDDIPAVETEGQLQRLAAIGCDHAQGFLLSRPLPAEQLAELL